MRKKITPLILMLALVLTLLPVLPARPEDTTVTTYADLQTEAEFTGNTYDTAKLGGIRINTGVTQTICFDSGQRNEATEKYQKLRR